jgi:hypothetical protein
MSKDSDEYFEELKKAVPELIGKIGDLVKDTLLEHQVVVGVPTAVLALANVTAMTIGAIPEESQRKNLAQMFDDEYGKQLEQTKRIATAFDILAGALEKKHHA